MFEFVLATWILLGVAATIAYLRTIGRRHAKGIDSQPFPPSSVDFAAVAMSAFDPTGGVKICGECGARLDVPGVVSYRVNKVMLCDACAPSCDQDEKP